MYGLAPSARVRSSPFFEATVADGVTAFTTYNQMLLPASYGDPEGEYWRLINGVSQWDVAVERQVQLRGRHAGRLAQILAARDLSTCIAGQGKYVPICNHRGTLINDPILLKRSDDLHWLSIADSNIWFWAEAIAAERGLDVEVSEPDVSPMALQGPKATDVVAHVCGDWVRELKYFGFRDAEIEGIPVVVARSGWSKQGGYEIYLCDGRRGNALWNIFREAGKAWDIGPGAPNGCERIESGLLNWGSDTDAQTNPFEVRMERFVDLDVPDDTVGIAALRRIAAEGPKRHQLGVILDDAEAEVPGFQWRPILRDGRRVGDMTNAVLSRRLGKVIGFGLLSRDCAPGDRVTVSLPGGGQEASVTELPFL